MSRRHLALALQLLFVAAVVAYAGHALAGQWGAMREHAATLRPRWGLVVLSGVPTAFGNKGRPNGQYVALVIAYSAMIQFVWLNYAAHAGDWLPYTFFPWEFL